MYPYIYKKDGQNKGRKGSPMATNTLLLYIRYIILYMYIDCYRYIIYKRQRNIADKIYTNITKGTKNERARAHTARTHALALMMRKTPARREYYVAYYATILHTIIQILFITIPSRIRYLYFSFTIFVALLCSIYFFFVFW